MVQLNRVQLLVFALTFLSYALYHATRKNLSGVKASISAEWTSNGSEHAPRKPLFPTAAEANTFLGSLDALFMLFYAGALIFWGWLGDRLNVRDVVALGMVGSAVTLTLFGTVPYWMNLYSIPYYLLTYAAFGIFQACGWPNEVAIMANWFPKTNRGFIMGLWAACQPVGNILGAIIVSLILPYGYQTTFLFNSLLILVGAGCLLLCISARPPMPIESGEPAAPISHHRGIGRHSSEEFLSERYPMGVNRPITMLEALFLPSVLPYCLCNACLKFVNYAFFFWLPFYLTHQYSWPEIAANQLAVWYDIGGIVGSIAGGWISDSIGHRSPVISAMLVCSLPLLLIYAELGASTLLHILVMLLLGATISGPYNLIVGTIAVDLGSQPALAGNTEAMSTVTGLIDGIGSGGSAVGQFFIPLIQNGLGWSWVFYLFIIMNFLSMTCLLKRLFHDFSVMFRRPQASSSSEEASPLLSPIEQEIMP